MVNLGQIVADYLKGKKNVAEEIVTAPKDTFNPLPIALEPQTNIGIRPRIATPQNTFESDSQLPAPAVNNAIRPRIVNQPPPDKIEVPQRQTPDSAMADLLPIRPRIEPDNNPQTINQQPPPNTSIRPRIAGDSKQWEIDQNRQMINDPALAKIPENKPSKLKAAIALALESIANSVESGGSLGRALGAGIGGAGAGFFAPKLYADKKHQFRINQLQKEQEDNFKKREQELGLEGKQADINWKKNRPEIEREKLRNRIEIEKEKQANKIANLKLQNANKEDDWDEFIRDGKVWKLYKNRDGNDGRNVLEPLIDPETGAQMQPAEDQLYEVWSETAGRYVKAKGRDALGVDMANASRETSVNVANASAQNRYNNEIYDWQKNVDSANAEITAKDSEYAGLVQKDTQLNVREEQLTQEIASMSGDILKSEQVKDKQTELAKLRTERTNLISEQAKLKGELEKSRQVYENLKKNKPIPPTTTQAVTTGKTMTRTELEKIAQMKNMTPQAAEEWVKKEGYKIQSNGKYENLVFQSPASLKRYFPDKTEAEIKQIVEANGGRFSQ